MIGKEVLKKTIKLDPPWEVANINFEEESETFIIKVVYKKKALLKQIKENTGKEVSIYDHISRRWRYLDIWQYKSYIEVRVPRIKYKDSNSVEQVKVPWADKFSRTTHLFESVIIDSLVKMSIKDVNRTHSVSWYTVEKILDKYITKMRSKVNYDLNYIGIDEISRKKGHKYFTLVYDLTKGHVIWIGKDRKSSTLKKFIRWYGKKKIKKIKGVAIDMWDPYIKALEDYAIKNKIVFDKFHITKHLNDAMDKTRREENSQLLDDKILLLKKTKYIWLKNPRNLTEKQEITLEELLKYRLKSVKAYELKELFKFFWRYKTKKHAALFFNRWFWRATHSRIESIKKVAYTLKKYFYGVINYIKHSISNGRAEGINNKIRVYTKRAYGYKTDKMMMNMIYLTCGGIR
ncbi:ISL3 family transposase [Candidatus Dependentiae bacterium]|nr:ISL3 family transposase [Candidatus Dependentiae bacterium]